MKIFDNSFPARDPEKPAEEQGLFHKFDVRRTDGSSEPEGKHYGCRYFVLDLNHDPYAPAAMRAYAAACVDTHPALAVDIAKEFSLPFTDARRCPIAYLKDVDDWQKARIAACEARMHHFCDRVEKGEVKSTRTYADFCDFLDRPVKGYNTNPIAGL